MKSEHDSIPTISTVPMTGDTSFEASSCAVDQSVGVNPQPCGSGGDSNGLLDHAPKPSVRPHVAARKRRPSKVCVKSEPLPVLQQPVHVGCVTGLQQRERQSSAHPPSSGRSFGCFDAPTSDESASYRSRALLH